MQKTFPSTNQSFAAQNQLSRRPNPLCAMSSSYLLRARKNYILSYTPVKWSNSIGQTLPILNSLHGGWSGGGGGVVVEGEEGWSGGGGGVVVEGKRWWRERGGGGEEVVKGKRW